MSNFSDSMNYHPPFSLLQLKNENVQFT